MSELTGNRIRTTAGKLGLPHLAETINEYIRRADEAKMGYLDFLDLVLSEELADRDDRRFRQGLRLSKLPHHKTLQLSGVGVRCPALSAPRRRDHAARCHAQAPEPLVASVSNHGGISGALAGLRKFDSTRVARSSICQSVAELTTRMGSGML